jgi:hypothetical protein
MKRRSLHSCLLLLFSFCPIGYAQESIRPAATCKNTEDTPAASTSATATPSKSRALVRLQQDMYVVRDASFPELQKKLVKTTQFESSADYFRARFSVSRFLLLQPMHYFVEINPRIENSEPSAESICAILAHELVHISRMSQGNRIHLFGLVRLVSPGYTARFERSTDLEAIRRGYGEGLIGFREWVYKSIPAEALKRKRRNYFSPGEITAILRMTQTKPKLFAYWNKHVPLNLKEIEKGAQ